MCKIPTAQLGYGNCFIIGSLSMLRTHEVAAEQVDGR
jgi:hypothetical protein